MYRVYRIHLILNGVLFTELWIDPHYEEKHSGYMNDELIIELVKLIDKNVIPPVGELEDFIFLEIDTLFKEKIYRLILVLPPDLTYLGVRNAYRRSK